MLAVCKYVQTLADQMAAPPCTLGSLSDQGIIQSHGAVLGTAGSSSMRGNPHLILQGTSEAIAPCLITQLVRGLPDIFLVLNMLGSLCFCSTDCPAQCLVYAPAGRKVCKGYWQHFYFYYCKAASASCY